MKLIGIIGESWLDKSRGTLTWLQWRRLGPIKLWLMRRVVEPA